MSALHSTPCDGHLVPAIAADELLCPGCGEPLDPLSDDAYCVECQVEDEQFTVGYRGEAGW